MQIRIKDVKNHAFHKKVSYSINIWVPKLINTEISKNQSVLLDILIYKNWKMALQFSLVFLVSENWFTLVNDIGEYVKDIHNSSLDLPKSV